jgi:hypothetical protein
MAILFCPEVTWGFLSFLSLSFLSWKMDEYQSRSKVVERSEESLKN